MAQFLGMIFLAGSLLAVALEHAGKIHFPSACQRLVGTDNSSSNKTQEPSRGDSRRFLGYRYE